MALRHLLAGLVLCAPAANAAGLDISLSEKSAHFQYLFDSGSLGYGGADVGAGIFFNEADDVLGTGHLLVTSNPRGQSNIQFGVGAKAYGGVDERANSDDQAIGAVGVGGLVRLILPAQTPMGVAVEGYRAPEITSFADTRDLSEIMARFEIEVMPSTRGYFGYRLLEPDTEEFGEVEFDDRFHVGIRITY